MSGKWRAIHSARYALAAISRELRSSIEDWEQETGLTIARIDLDRVDVTQHNDPGRHTRLLVTCHARLSGQESGLVEP